MSYNSLTKIPGIKVGHAQDFSGLTGCTVILCEQGAVAGVDVRGSAPGTRETDLMRPANLVEKINAIILAGGSAFGLDAASGTMKFLSEKGYGYQTEFGLVPIVGGAVIYDLGVGSAEARPNSEMGYEACCKASCDPVQEGNVGAGTGASVAKLLGQKFAVKSGIGSFAINIGQSNSGQELWVGALVVLNALGSIYDGSNRLAAPYDRVNKRFVELEAIGADHSSNTTIAVVATNVSLSKEGANKVAQMAHDGLARAIDPIHTMFDGDTIFALSTCDDNHIIDANAPQEITTVGMIGAKALKIAVIRAIEQAESLGGLPSFADIR